MGRENRRIRKKRYVRLQDTNISSVGSDRILGVVPLARDPVADIRNEADYLVRLHSFFLKYRSLVF